MRYQSFYRKVTNSEEITNIFIQVGAGIQIPPSSSRVLKDWGLLDRVRRFATLPNDFHLRSRDGKILSTQNIRPSLEDKYGYPYLQVHRARYHQIMTDEATRLGVKITLGAEVTHINFETPSITLRSQPNSELVFDLIIGADGLRSRCREALLGRSDPPRLTGDLAYRSTVPVANLSSTLLRRLVEKPCTNYWMGQNRHAMSYLIENDQVINIVLIIPDNLPEGVNVAAAEVDEMQRNFEGWDPTLTELLQQVQSTCKWRLQDSVEMERWSHPAFKFTLLGDACHATLPYL